MTEPNVYFLISNLVYHLASPQFNPGADHQIVNHFSKRLHLLDFGCLWDTLQVSLEHQDFGVFLFQDGDQVVQESDVSANTQTNNQPSTQLICQM